MRSTIGILTGLSLIGLVACSSDTTTVVKGSGPAGTNPDDPTTTEETPTDPSTTGDPTDKDAPAPPLVAGLAIQDIAVFQAVKIDVVKDLKVVAGSSRKAPVVSNRPALFRVYVTPGSGWSSRSVTAELRLVDGTTRLPVVKSTKTISEESTDEDIDSTFNFEVPATSLPPGVTYQVLLTDTKGAVPTGAVDSRFPRAGGVQDLAAETSGKLKIVIVPVKYDADGSGRVPDTSTAQLERYRKTFMSMYPATEVIVTARAPWSYTSPISGNGSGFSAVLNAVTNLRKADKAASDVYYYGALAPTSSFNSFCGGGCVTGLSTVVTGSGNNSAFLRASVGVGFPGQDSVDTAAHEIGHAHGRNHSPCGGAQGTDPAYPYSGGVIGVWGYDINAKTFISPTKGHDMMAYCPNEWVSDFTYSALFDRIAAVNGVSASSGGSGSGSGGGSGGGSSTFRMATVEADGSVAWGGDVDLDSAPTGGETRMATFVSATGQTLESKAAQFFPYDHLPGGVLVVPPGPGDSKVVARARVRDVAASTWSSVRVSGLANALTR